MLRKLTIVTLSAALAAAAFALPQEVTFQQGVGSYLGTLDTELRQEPSDAGTPQGDATGISIDAADPSPYITNGLIRFEGLFGAAPGQIPAGAVIQSATLRLRVFNEGSGLKLHRMLANWDESSTWNSMTGGVSPNDIEAVMMPDASAGMGNGSGNVPAAWLSLNCLPSLQAWQGGAMNYGWSLLPFAGGTNGIDFYTSEYSTVANRPQLVVTYEPIPEPASIALLAAGLLVAGRRAVR